MLIRRELISESCSLRFESSDLPADDLKKTYRVLVCLPPDQRELTMIKQLLPDLSKVFAEAEISLLASPGKNIYDIFPRKGFNILTPKSDSISWVGLATGKYIDSLKAKKFNLILDMNLTTNIFTQSILLNYPSAIRVGKGNSLGSPFYNLEIKTKFIRDEKNIYRSMIDIMDSLKNNRSAINGAVS